MPLSPDDFELVPRLADPQAERLWKQIEGERASGASLAFDGPAEAGGPPVAARTHRDEPPDGPEEDPPDGAARSMKVALAEAFQRDVRDLSEAHRVGLGLRLGFALEPDRLTLLRVDSHDDIRRYLRQL